MPGESETRILSTVVAECVGVKTLFRISLASLFKLFGSTCMVFGFGAREGTLMTLDSDDDEITILLCLPL